MVKIIEEPVTGEDLKELQEGYKGYVKVVVDVQREVLAAGGEYHIDCEQVLIADGSRQSDLWGGGYDVVTGEVDFFAMSNYQPAQSRVTYEIADPEIRRRFRKLVHHYFPSKDE